MSSGLRNYVFMPLPAAIQTPPPGGKLPPCTLQAFAALFDEYDVTRQQKMYRGRATGPPTFERSMDQVTQVRCEM
jgi:hypothetical protein